ncbi:WD repeat-containing protein 89 [Balamuthia mandrillaris]
MEPSATAATPSQEASASPVFKPIKTHKIPNHQPPPKRPHHQHQQQPPLDEDDDADRSCYVCQFAVSPALPSSSSSTASSLGSTATTQVLAAADSSFGIGLFSRQTLEVVGRLTGHADAVSQLAFSASNASLLWSSSDDGSVRCWDLRQQAVVLGTQVKSSVHSFTLESSSEHVLAAGAGKDIMFWDLRKDLSKPLTVFEDSHTEDITRLRFHPFVPGKLFSGSIDGLVCLFDVSQSIVEEDALLEVLPVNEAVATFGFFGARGEDLYVLSTDQTFSAWNIDKCEELVKVKDAREALSVDYYIDCYYHAPTEKLLLFSGTNAGQVSIIEVTSTGMVPLQRLSGGHTSIVRCFDWDVQNHNIVTGGEDSCISMWTLSS